MPRAAPLAVSFLTRDACTYARLDDRLSSSAFLLFITDLRSDCCWIRSIDYVCPNGMSLFSSRFRRQGKGYFLFQNADVLGLWQIQYGVGSRNECRRYSDIGVFETEFELKIHTSSHGNGRHPCCILPLYQTLLRLLSVTQLIFIVPWIL